MKHRLKSLRDSHRFSQNHIANILGISQSAYSQIEKGTVSLSLEHLRRLCQEYHVSMDWLTTGKGPRSRPSFADDYIPLVDIAAKAGYIENIGNEEFLNELELYRVPGFPDGNFRIFEVAGNSMKPAILPHDHLICTKVNELSEIVDGSICVVVTNDNIVVKRVSFERAQREEILLKSDNKQYKPYKVCLKDVLEIWLVSAKLTTSLMPEDQEQEGRILKLENEFNEVKKQLQSLLPHLNTAK